VRRKFDASARRTTRSSESPRHVRTHMAISGREPGLVRPRAAEPSTSTGSGDGWDLRFFDIDELAGVRIEIRAFRETHAKGARLVATASSTVCIDIRRASRTAESEYPRAASTAAR